MQLLLDITLLLAILILVIISCNHQVSAKKRTLYNRHSHHRKGHNNYYNHYHHHNRHKGHHRLTVSHRQVPPLNPYLRAITQYCSLAQDERIIQGYNVTDRNSFPYMAIYYSCSQVAEPVSISDCQPLCGGSIISHYHILTVAHCMFTPDEDKIRRQPRDLFVRVGIHNLQSPEVTLEGYSTTLPVENIFVHENYDHTATHDIAIIRLKEAIIFSDYIRPVCVNGLHLRYDFKDPYPNVIMAGFGRTTPDSPMSDILKYAKLYISSFYDCWSYPEESQKLIEFCAKNYYWNEGYSCQGDSGSGLLPTDGYYNPYNVIVGVLHGTFGSTCTLPLRFINVTTYATWINETAQ